MFQTTQRPRIPKKATFSGDCVDVKAGPGNQVTGL